MDSPQNKQKGFIMASIEQLGVQINAVELKALNSALKSFRLLHDLDVKEYHLKGNRYWEGSIPTFRYLNKNTELLLPKAREFAFNKQTPIFFGRLIYSALMNPFIPLDLDEMHTLVKLFHRIKNLLPAPTKKTNQKTKPKKSDKNIK